MERPAGKQPADPFKSVRLPVWGDKDEDMTTWMRKKFEETQKFLDGPAIDEKLSLPFSMECKGCTSVIAAGVKLNDEREKVDTLSGKVWRFNVKCPCCGFNIVIQTCCFHPGYVIIKGAEEHPKRAMSRASEEMYKLIYPLGEIQRRRKGPKKLNFLWKLKNSRAPPKRKAYDLSSAAAV